MKKAPKITLYSTTSCAHCKQAKAFFKQKGVQFQEWNVQRNQRAYKEWQRLGSRGVPVIVIAGEKIDGFNKSKLEKALLKHGAI